MAGLCSRETISQNSYKLHVNTHSISSTLLLCYCGSGSSVSIATDYGLECLGSNPGGDEILRPSIPALGPTQPPVK
jgi:hypothetical protein